MCKVLSHASQSSHSPRFLVLFIKRTFWNSYFKILVEPHYEGNDDQFAKYCQTLRNHRFQLTFVNHRYQLTLWCLPSERHFEAVTVKLSLNAITTKKIADFQNSVTRL